MAYCGRPTRRTVSVEGLVCVMVLWVCLRVLESVGRCAKKMKIGIPTADVLLRRPEENEDDSRAAEVRDGMKRRECRTKTGGCCRRDRVRPARREQSRAAKKKVG